MYIEDCFDIGSTQIRWGTAFHEAVQLASGLEQYTPPNGSQTIRCKCTEIFGMRANEVSISAPLPDRPVLHAHYQVAPIRAGFLQWLHRPYVTRLSRLWGEPQAITKNYNQTRIDKKQLADVVVYNARWTLGDVRIALSVYGAPRDEDSGTSAAGIFVDWKNEIKAAAPFRELREKAANRIAASVRNTTPLDVYRSDMPQQPFYMADYDLPDPHIALHDPLLRHSHLALYKRSLLPTPSSISERLKDQDIAFYYLADLQLWLVATKWDAITLSADEKDAITFCDTLPARGPGSYGLLAKELSIRATRNCNVLQQLASRILAETGCTVKTETTFDD